MKLKISPSILSANFTNLEREIKKICASNADFIHIDVMDGHFVPNITFGPQIIKSIRNISTLNFDVHLMISNPEKYIDEYVNAGADIITFHFEATNHVDRLVDLIKSKNCKVGISLLPTTSENFLKYIIDKIDLVLVMTVNPGFGGQKFMSNQLTKIRNIKLMIEASNKDIILSVDGGINLETAKFVKDAGATMVVSGNYLFLEEGMEFEERILALKNI